MKLVATVLLAFVLVSFLNGEERRERRNAASLSAATKVIRSLRRQESPKDWQWYLKDTPISMNVRSAWRKGFTGEGILVAVVDDGVNMKHPDLRPKFKPEISYDFLKNRSISNNYSPGRHGTKCAGIIAGGYDRNYCGVGIAFDAQIASIRLYDAQNKPTEELEEKAFSYKNDLIDIYSNSWGPGDPGWRVQGPGPASRKALEEGTRSGRDGKGSIYVFSAGNGGMVGDSCAYSGYVNSIYTIAISAVNWDGSIPIYTESCAAIMAVTYGGSMTSIENVKAPIVTTMGDRQCTDKFPGTSGTAAMASGIIALALQANRDLTWRDVQHLIARSSKPLKSLQSMWSAKRPTPSWKINAANLTVSGDYGFGLMDANSMVEYAKKWTSVPEQLFCEVDLNISNSKWQQIPWSGKLNLHLKVDQIGCGIRYLEHMQVKVDLVFPRRGYLEMNSVSPSRTASKLLYPRMIDGVVGFKNLSNWTVTSLHYWGENPVGEWNITIQNTKAQRNTREGIYSKICRNIVDDVYCAAWKNRCKRNSYVIRSCAKTCKTCGPGRLYSLKLILSGTKEDPLRNNNHVNINRKEVMQFTPFEISERKRDIPIHGGYSRWSSWRPCSESCGGRGVQYRVRSCNNPYPANKGRGCEGPNRESRRCGIRSCPVDGGYSDWSVWSRCSLTCGGGIQRRSRSCINPLPAHGGGGCSRLGRSSNSRKCGTQPCPVSPGRNISCENVFSDRNCTSWKNSCTSDDFVRKNCAETCGTCQVDGGYSEWTVWSRCSLTCGGGIRSRSRSCTNPPKEHGGRGCGRLGRPIEFSRCNVDTCPRSPVDGGYSEWTVWSRCSLTCGGGIRSRSRSCANPPKEHGGRGCGRLGRPIEFNRCNVDTCPRSPVDGGYSEWTVWSRCSLTCGGGIRSRSRSCTNPPKEHGGRGCGRLGRPIEFNRCNVDTCPRSPVDGGYSEWNVWSRCSLTCGGGIRRRSRSCTNPPKEHGGRGCGRLGRPIEYNRCNVETCP